MCALSLLEALCLALGVVLSRVLHRPVLRLLWRLDVHIEYGLLTAIPLMIAGGVAILGLVLVGRRMVPGFRAHHGVALIVVYGGAFASLHALLTERPYPEMFPVWLAILAATGLAMTAWQIRIGRRSVGR